MFMKNKYQWRLTVKPISQIAFSLVENGHVPDIFIRKGIRHLIGQRLDEIQSETTQTVAQKQARFIEEMRKAPIALVPEKANEQHYEVPVEFFQKVLGPHHKYSSTYWMDNVTDLAEAEAAGLHETTTHALVENGQRILELGCGWGSLTLWMAKHFPHSRITAVSNSHTQRQYIQSLAKARGLDNVEVMTCDMNAFDIEPRQFDRVVSVEMFEHMRNWPELFKRVHGWLKPGGFFFMHIFLHREVPYLFEDKGPSDWMSRHFFTGGMMPSQDLPLAFQDDLQFVRRWRWEGTHYEKTANAWLANMDSSRNTLWPLFSATYGKEHTQTWWMRWRIFFMACAELFGYAKGQEWLVGHYLLRRKVI